MSKSSTKIHIDRKLSRSEQKYKELWDNAPIAYHTIDTNGLITDINETETKMLGYKKAEMLGKPIFNFIAKSQRKNAQERFKLKIKGVKLPKNFNRQYIKKNGGSIRVSIEDKQELDGHGKIIGIRSTMIDVTKEYEAKDSLQQNEQLLNSIIEATTDIMLMTNENRTICWANNQAKNVLGSDIVGKKCYQACHNTSKACAVCLSAKATKDGNFHEKETVIIDQQGISRDVWSTLNIVAKHKDGSPKLIMETLRDISKINKTKDRIKRLNEELEKKAVQKTWQLNQANKELNKALELKLKFISDASHELRTPLTIAQGNIDLAMRESKLANNKLPKFYSVIHNEIKQMTNILNDLSMLTNADSHAVHLSHENININMLIKDVSASLGVLTVSKNIKIVTQYHKNDFMIKGDEIQIEKLLINILRNAIKYSKKRGIIKIYAEFDKEEVKIFVEDNGIGIPEQDLPYIFERFYRVDKARSRSEGGTGLGLSICKWIAEAHGGKIDVQSKFGTGSKFIIHLPKDYKNSPINQKLF